MPPRRVDRVHPQYQLAVAVAALGESRPNNRPRVLFRLRSHGVFEVEDQAVGRQNSRFLERAWVRAGHKKEAAARPRRR